MPRVTSKGQVTIPKRIRDKYGFGTETEVEFREDAGRVYLSAPEDHRAQKMQRVIENIRRVGLEHGTGMTTDEIMVLMRGEDWNTV